VKWTGLSSGPGRLFVDGAPAGTLGGQHIEPGGFPSLFYETVLAKGADNSLSTPVLLPPLDAANRRRYDGTEDVELTVAGLQGFRMIVKAGSMTLPDGTVPSPNAPAVLSLNRVDADDVPMPMPDGANPPFAWTLQPSGATFDPPVEVRIPNAATLPAGATAYILSFDHDTEQFEIVASARVSDDGAEIVSEPGEGIFKSGWGSTQPPGGGGGGSVGLCAIEVEGPQEVCAGADHEFAYRASAQGNSTLIEWNVDGPGEIVSGQGTNEIVVRYTEAGIAIVSAELVCDPQDEDVPTVGAAVAVTVGWGDEFDDLENYELNLQIGDVELPLFVIEAFAPKIGTEVDLSFGCCQDVSESNFTVSISGDYAVDNTNGGLAIPAIFVPAGGPGRIAGAICFVLSKVTGDDEDAFACNLLSIDVEYDRLRLEGEVRGSYDGCAQRTDWTGTELALTAENFGLSGNLVTVQYDGEEYSLDMGRLKSTLFGYVNAQGTTLAYGVGNTAPEVLITLPLGFTGVLLPIEFSIDSLAGSVVDLVEAPDLSVVLEDIDFD